MPESFTPEEWAEHALLSQTVDPDDHPEDAWEEAVTARLHVLVGLYRQAREARAWRPGIPSREEEEAYRVAWDRIELLLQVAGVPTEVVGDVACEAIARFVTKTPTRIGDLLRVVAPNYQPDEGEDNPTLAALYARITRAIEQSDCPGIE